MTFFLGLHLILGGKLDVERREDFFFVFADIFSGNRKLRPSSLFQMSGHAPGLLIVTIKCICVITVKIAKL